jgi:hypothetical protein
MRFKIVKKVNGTKNNNFRPFGNLGCLPLLTSKFDEIEVERWVEERRMVMVS